MRSFFKYLFSFVMFLFVLSCEEKLSEEDISDYKKLMDIRLGHLGNALIMQGRLLDSYNLSSFRADEDHFKEAEEIIKGHLESLGRPDELKKLDIPNNVKIRNLHQLIIESSELMISAMNTLEDQAWIGGSVGFAEVAVDKARYNFQTVIKDIYKPKEDVKPILEHKEYDVGEKPEKVFE